jgi:PilZ domain
MQEESVPLKLRLLRWLFPDINRRRAKRIPAPGLVAYYWTGGSPHSYEVANISATGLYLLTKERWAPETMIQMTLQKGENAGSTSDGSICVLSEVVRWGDDGTGFNFILKDYYDSRTHEELPGEPVDRRTVEKFLKHVVDSVQ